MSGHGRGQVEGVEGVDPELLAAASLQGEIEGRGERRKGPMVSSLSSLRRVVRHNRMREEEGIEGVGPELTAARSEEEDESVGVGP